VRLAILVATLGIAAIAGLLGVRILLPTEPTWILFPLRSETVFCQNPVLWLAGRSYADRRVLMALDEASAHLQQWDPGARLSYLDVGHRHPGRLWPHKSHRKGLDVDIQYFGRDASGYLLPQGPSLFAIGYHMKYGENRKWRGRKFDAEANWRLLEGLRANRSCGVEHIFVEPYIKDWLIDEGRRQNASEAAFQWATRIFQYAGDDAGDHRDHFHIRFSGD
jgi:murein endopeptidase